mgnify:CR=1 FL=1
MHRFPHKAINAALQTLKLTLVPTKTEPLKVALLYEEDEDGQIHLLPISPIIPANTPLISEPVATEASDSFLEDLAKLGVHVPEVNQDPKPDIVVNKSNRVKLPIPCVVLMYGDSQSAILFVVSTSKYSNDHTR